MHSTSLHFSPPPAGSRYAIAVGHVLLVEAGKLVVCCLAFAAGRDLSRMFEPSIDGLAIAFGIVAIVGGISALLLPLTWVAKLWAWQMDPVPPPAVHPDDLDAAVRHRHMIEGLVARRETAAAWPRWVHEDPAVIAASSARTIGGRCRVRRYIR